jgi:hypothetical protein
MALGLTAVLAFVSLLISRGLQGNAWAMGVSVALIALVGAFLAYAVVFGLVYLVSRIWNRASPARRPGAGEGVSAVGVPAAPREPADLAPTASELT